MNESTKVTAVVLAHNEAENIAACIESLACLTDDILVLDSGSVDGTAEIARDLGAKVFFNEFSGFGQQRNWAIDNLPHQHQWVLHLDADERCTPQFASAVRAAIAANSNLAGYWVPSKLIFHGKWLKHCSGYPVYQVRLFHIERLRFQDHGHGQREVTQGTLGYLREPYLHFGFSKGLSAWLRKHVDYAMAEANEAMSDQSSAMRGTRMLLSSNSVQRRRGLKALSYHLPFRGALRFFQLYVLKLGFLDGRPGFLYSRMMALYEEMASLAIRDSRIRAGSSEQTDKSELAADQGRNAGSNGSHSNSGDPKEESCLK